MMPLDFDLKFQQHIISNLRAVFGSSEPIAERLGVSVRRIYDVMTGRRKLPLRYHLPLWRMAFGYLNPLYLFKIYAAFFGEYFEEAEDRKGVGSGFNVEYEILLTTRMPRRVLYELLDEVLWDLEEYALPYSFKVAYEYICQTAHVIYRNIVYKRELRITQRRPKYYYYRILPAKPFSEFEIHYGVRIIRKFRGELPTLYYLNRYPHGHVITLDIDTMKDIYDPTAHEIRRRVSAGGKGYHYVLAYDDEMNLSTMLDKREALGDDELRVNIDRFRSTESYGDLLTPPQIYGRGVLFRFKSNRYAGVWRWLKR